LKLLGSSLAKEFNNKWKLGKLVEKELLYLITILF
jgi:hypothetical protein